VLVLPPLPVLEAVLIGDPPVPADVELPLSLAFCDEEQAAPNTPTPTTTAKAFLIVFIGRSLRETPTKDPFRGPPSAGELRLEMFLGGFQLSASVMQSFSSHHASNLID
jgi:hypothetical protein